MDIVCEDAEFLGMTSLSIRDAFKIKKTYILGLCPKVVDPLPSPPYLGQKILGLFGLHLDPLPPL